MSKMALKWIMYTQDMINWLVSKAMLQINLIIVQGTIVQGELLNLSHDSKIFVICKRM